MNISIVVPTWNLGEMLKDFLNSLLKQTVQIWDLYILDDGSTDNTRAVIEKFKTMTENKVIYMYCDDPTRLFKMKWLSHMYVDGDIIFFPDSDDVLLPEALEAYLEKFHTHPSLDFIYGSSVMIDEEGNIERLIEAKYPQEINCINPWAPYLDDQYKGQKFRCDIAELNNMPYTSIIHCSRDNIQVISLPFAFRKSSIAKLSHEHLRVNMAKGDDIEFMGKCEHLGLKYYAMKELVYVKRSHVQRMSDTSSKFESQRSSVSWWDSIEMARDYADANRSQHFISNNFFGTKQKSITEDEIEYARTFFLDILKSSKSLFE